MNAENVSAGQETEQTGGRRLRNLIDADRSHLDGEQVEAHVRRRIEVEHSIIVAALAYPHAVIATGLKSSEFTAPDYSLLWMSVEGAIAANPQAQQISQGDIIEHARRLGARFRTPDGHNVLLRLTSDSPVSIDYALRVLVKELRAADDVRVWADTARSFAERAGKSTDPLALRHEWVIESQSIAQRYDAGPAASNLDEASLKWRSKGTAGSLVPTGFPEIDKSTGGGLGRGDLMVVGGGTNHGKSYLANRMLKNQAVMNRSVLYISVEDSEELLMCRMLADFANPKLVPTDIRMAMHGMPSPADPLAIDAAAASMKAAFQGRVKTISLPKATVSQIVSAIRSHRYLHGVDMVIVDYLQAVEPDETSNNKTQDVAYTVSKLKKIANEVGVALVMLSQYARDEYRDGAEPTVNSCKYAGDIENESEVMLLLWRDEQHQLMGKLAKLKWASSVGHRYLIATDSTTGAVLDWEKVVVDPNEKQDEGKKKRAFGRRKGGDL